VVAIAKERISPQDDSRGIVRELERLNLKVDSLAESYRKVLSVQMKILRLLRGGDESSYFEEIGVVPDAMRLLSLPGSLRKTMLALYKLGESTATDLSRETERLRAVESACANQLTRMGYLKKKRVGRKVYFYIDQNLQER
jgi:hypothetical protein